MNRDTKISKQVFIGFVEKDIGRFDIAINEPVQMDIIQSLGEFDGCLVERTFLDDWGLETKFRAREASRVGSKNEKGYHRYDRNSMQAVEGCLDGQKPTEEI